jgi:hypothetical protein
LAVPARDGGGYGDNGRPAGHLFIMRFMRLLCTVRLVSTIVVTRSLSDSVHSLAANASFARTGRKRQLGCLHP